MGGVFADCVLDASGGMGLRGGGGCVRFTGSKCMRLPLRRVRWHGVDLVRARMGCGLGSGGCRTGLQVIGQTVGKCWRWRVAVNAWPLLCQYARVVRSTEWAGDAHRHTKGQSLTSGAPAQPLAGHLPGHLYSASAPAAPQPPHTHTMLSPTASNTIDHRDTSQVARCPTHLSAHKSRTLFSPSPAHKLAQPPLRTMSRSPGCNMVRCRPLCPPPLSERARARASSDRHQSALVARSWPGVGSEIIGATQR